MRSPTLLAVLLLIIPVFGCSPQWHANETIALHHSIDRAAVYGRSVSVQGRITPVVAVTDYGFKSNEARDDLGNSLKFRSFQLFWMKELRFEVELELPDSSAKEVSLDFEFRSRAGVQRLRSTLPLERNVSPDYRTQLRRWTESP